MTRIVGLDIGSGVLRAAEIKDPARPKPTLLRYHEVPVPEGAIAKGEVIDRDAVVYALKQLWTDGKFGSKEVVLGMGNHRILARDHVVREQPLAQIREQLPFQVQDLLPVPVSDALLDFYPFATEQTDQGPMIHGLLVAAIKEAVLANVEAVEAAGLHVAEVDLIPFALTRLMLGNEFGRGMTALVDIGASTTYVIMARDGVPQFIRVIGSGGRDITESIVLRHDIPFLEAERVKRSLGVAPRQLAPEAQPFAESVMIATNELLTGVRNTISYFVNSHPGTTVERIVLSGGGGRMPGIREAFAELTRLPVVDAQLGGHLTIARSVRAEARNWLDSSTVAVGLAVGSRA